jgi:glycosyltransferase involved in cell wall biosynthesis
MSNRLRICLVYDCLYPHSIGGVERWYRSLAEQLSARGCQITYLTLRQWTDGPLPPPGVQIVEVGPRLNLYARSGRRRILPALAFGLGVARHLARQGGDYDVVHTCSFPYFSVLAAAAFRRRWRYRLVVDWFEVWSRDYWRRYLGVVGELGWVVQSACMRVRHQAFCFSALTARRLHTPSSPRQISCAYGIEKTRSVKVEPLVVYAGRHIPEKRVPLIVAAIAAARREIPDLRGLILGDGPELGIVRAVIRAHGLDGVVEAPGRVAAEDVQVAVASARCVVSASSREGFGLLVLEAAAAGTPSVLVAGADNAAVELIEPGVNGIVAASATAAALAEAIIQVDRSGTALRGSTAAWYERNEERFSPVRAVDEIVDAYGAVTRS